MGDLDWAIYYFDGTRFTNLDGEPWEAPPFGVEGIGCKRGMWQAHNYLGLVQYLIRPGAVKCVRFGYATSNEQYEQALNWAREDRDLPTNRVINEGQDYYCWYGDV
jgi:hypothetical protein